MTSAKLFNWRAVCIVLTAVLGLAGVVLAGAHEDWVARYDGSGNADDKPVAVATDNLGNVYVTGFSQGVGSGYDYATLKYDQAGSLLWERRYNGPENGDDFAVALKVDDWGNVYVAGNSQGPENMDYLTLKYDSDGTLLWEQRQDYQAFEESWVDEVVALDVDEMGNAYVTGTSKLTEYEDSIASDGLMSFGYTFKYDPDGTMLWHRILESEDGSTCARDQSIDDAGNVHVTGSILSSDGTDCATIKYSPDGDIQWCRFYNAPSDSDDIGLAIDVDRSGNVYVAGMTKNLNGFAPYDWNDLILKYDADGTLIWERIHGYPGAESGAGAATVDGCGNIVIIDNYFQYMRLEHSGGYTLKYDFAGNLVFEKYFPNEATWDSHPNGYSSPFTLAPDKLGNVYVTGYVEDPGTVPPYTGYNFQTLKYDSHGNEIWRVRYDWSAAHDRASAITVDESGNIYVTGSSGGDYATIKYVQTPPDQYPLDDNTVALYHFDVDFSDASVHGLNLNVFGNTVLAWDNLGWMDSPTGQMMRTMGLGDYVSVEIPDNLILPSNNCITIDARIFPREFKAHAITNAKVLSLFQGWDTMMEIIDGKWNSPAVPHVVIDGQTLVTPNAWLANIPMNQWSHLRLNYYGGDNMGEVFVNGTSVGSKWVKLNASRTQNWTFTLGNFSGDIDEVRISNIRRGWESYSNGPTNLSANLLNSSCVQLCWTGVQGSTLYNIYRDGMKIGESDIITYEDSDLPPNRTYRYVVSCQLPGGEGPKSLPVEITTPADPANGGGAYDVDEHTVALYHFEGSFEDAGPNGLNLTTAGGAALATDGLGGQVLRATNLGDKAVVSIPDALILPSGGSPITIDALFRPRAYLAYGINNYPVISLYQSWDSMLEAIDGKWNTPQAPHVVAGSHSRIIASSGAWNENATMNEWHHLRITYDTDGMMYVYIDRVLIGSTEVYNNGIHVSDNPVSMNASRPQNWILTLGNFDGDIDEVRISNIVRTDWSPLIKTAGNLSAAEASDGEANAATMSFGLAQNYPNPFNPSTTISYTLTDASMVRLSIYNILGQRIRTLVNTVQRHGFYNIAWDGTNDLGSSVAPGIYIYRIEAGKNIAARKMVLAK